MTSISVGILALLLLLGGSPTPPEDRPISHHQASPSPSSPTPSSSSLGNSSASVAASVPGSAVPNVQLSKSSFNPNLEYRVILEYILSYFPSTPRHDAEEIAANLVDYGQVHDLDPKLIAALIAKESSFQREAISPTGAKGLGQIKSFNFPSLGIQDPFNIKQNISGTYQYITELLDTWSGDQNRLKMALASYYNGPNAMKRAEGQMNENTTYYVDTILKYYNEMKEFKKGF